MAPSSRFTLRYLRAQAVYRKLKAAGKTGPKAVKQARAGRALARLGTKAGLRDTMRKVMAQRGYARRKQAGQTKLGYVRRTRLEGQRRAKQYAAKSAAEKAKNARFKQRLSRIKSRSITASASSKSGASTSGSP